MSHNHSIVCDSRSTICGNYSTPYGSRFISDVTA